MVNGFIVAVVVAARVLHHAFTCCIVIFCPAKIKRVHVCVGNKKPLSYSTFSSWFCPAAPPRLTLLYPALPCYGMPCVAMPPFIIAPLSPPVFCMRSLQLWTSQGS